MSALLTPSIKYAREGFPVSEVIAYYWQMNQERIGHYDGFAETFLIDGKVPQKGDVFKKPWLSRDL